MDPEVVKSHANVTAAEILTTSFVALVAVTAVIVPMMENADVDVHIEASLVAGLLSYSIEIDEPAEDQIYYAVVLEDGSIISQRAIENGRLSDHISGLPPYKEHTVQVKSGHPPEYLVSSLVIPAAEVWAEWRDLSSEYTTIDYSLVFHGATGTASISLYDPAAGAIVYSESLLEGSNSGTIRNLAESHTYTVYVSSESELYLVSDVDTKAPDARWDHLSAKDNTVSYGVVVEGNEQMTIDMYDPASSSAVYSAPLSKGMNTGTVSGLEYGHTYRVTVSSQGKVHLSSDVRTEAEPTKATLGSLTVVEKDINYYVTVTGDRDVATLYLTDTGSGSVFYSVKLSVGDNEGSISGVEYSHTYLFTVSTEKETLISQTVTTEVEPTTAKLDSLVVTDNNIEYAVTVTGSRDAATANLYEVDGGSPLYSRELSEGPNSRYIWGLEYGHTYVFTVSTEKEILISQTVTTELESTSVELGYLTPTEDTIDYGLTVTGNRDVATLYLSDPTSGSNLYTKQLSVGANSETISGLEPGHTYQFTVSTGKQTLISESVTTVADPTTVNLDSLSVTDNSVRYGVTVTGTSDVATLYLSDPTSGSVLYTKQLSVGSNSDTIAGLEYGKTYRFTVSSEKETFINETVAIDPQLVTDYLRTNNNTIEYGLTINGSDDATLHVYLGNEEVGPGVALGQGSVTGVCGTSDDDFDIDWGTTYVVKVTMGGDTINIGTVTTVKRVITDYLRANDNIIEYGFTINGTADAEMNIYQKLGSGGIISDPVVSGLPLGHGTVTGTCGTTEDYTIDWGTTYVVKVVVEEEEYDAGEVTTADRFITNYFRTNVNVIEYGLTINGTEDATLCVRSEEEDVGYRVIGYGNVTGTVSTEDDDFDIDWGSSYTVWIIFEDNEYKIGDADIVERVIVNGLAANGNTIQYDLTINGTEDAILHVYLEVDEVGEGILLGHGDVTGTVGVAGDGYEIEWGAEYWVEATVGEESYPIGSVEIPEEVEIGEPVGGEDTIWYDVTVNTEDTELPITLNLYRVATGERVGDVIQSVPLGHGSNTGSFEGLETNVWYDLVVMFDDYEYDSVRARTFGTTT